MEVLHALPTPYARSTATSTGSMWLSCPVSSKTITCSRCTRVKRVWRGSPTAAGVEGARRRRHGAGHARGERRCADDGVPARRDLHVDGRDVVEELAEESAARRANQKDGREDAARDGAADGDAGEDELAHDVDGEVGGEGRVRPARRHVERVWPEELVDHLLAVSHARRTCEEARLATGRGARGSPLAAGSGREYNTNNVNKSSRLASCGGERKNPNGKVSIAEVKATTSV